MRKTKTSIAQELDRQFRDRLRGDQHATRSGQVCWRLERDGWHAPRRVFVTEYSHQIFRFRNDLAAPFIKKVWPFPVTNESFGPTFEVTAQADEIDRAFLQTLIKFVEEMAEHGGPQTDWPIFSDSKAYPKYAWTAKAHEVVEVRRKATEARRARRSG